MKMSGTVNFTGLNKTKFSSVPYDSSKFILKKDDFVELLYGADPANFKRIVGKVKEVKENGCWVYTDFGWMHPSWDRISRVFVPRTKGMVTEDSVRHAVKKITDRVNKPKKQHGIMPIRDLVNNKPSLKFLDAIIDKFIARTKSDFPEIKINDNRTDTKTTFCRTTTFTGKDHRTAVLSIADANAICVDIAGSVIKKKAKIKPNKGGQIRPHQSYLMMSRIKSLVK